MPMIQTNYNAIPDELFGNYLNYLIGKVYKILCMREEDDKTLEKYMRSLQRELTGNQELIVKLKYDSDFLSLLGKIEFLIHHDPDLPIYKKDIFDCISLIKKMQEKYFEKEE